MSSKSISDSTRCTHTTADGRRCRAPRLNKDVALCVHHLRRQLDSAEAADPEALALELFGAHTEFKTATAVNHALGKLFSLAARNQIPARKAAVLAYIGQLLLHTLSGVQSEYRKGYNSDGWHELVCRDLETDRLDPAVARRRARAVS